GDESTRGAATPGVIAGRDGPDAAVGPCSVLGALRIKNESAHIREVLERALAICERILVRDDSSTDDTVAICQSVGERVNVLPSPYVGLDEVRDKNHLLSRIKAEDPEWVIWIDGDEVFEQAAPARIQAAMAQATGVAAFSLRIAYIWD